MAPEVLQGESATELSDLYAIGVIAYELFTGRHPFHVDDVKQLMHDVLYTMPDAAPLSALNVSVPPVILTQQATDSLRQALHIAQEMSAKSLELRAAMSLYRVEGESARPRLAAVYGGFTEGFETADLKKAQALLNPAS